MVALPHGLGGSRSGLGDRPPAEIKWTFAEAFAHEAEQLRRRFVHATRPRGPMTLEEAQDLCRRMAGEEAQ